MYGDHELFSGLLFHNDKSLSGQSRKTNPPNDDAGFGA